MHRCIFDAFVGEGELQVLLLHHPDHLSVFLLRIALAVEAFVFHTNFKTFCSNSVKNALIDTALNLLIALCYIVYFSPKIFVTVPGTSENALNTGRGC